MRTQSDTASLAPETMLRASFEGHYPNGRRRPIEIELGSPRQARTGEWRCDVRVSPLAPRARICAEDALQALCLAVELLSQTLYAARRRGIRITYPDGDAVPLHVYFRVREYQHRLARVAPKRGAKRGRGAA